jgi:hypothetical protein
MHGGERRRDSTLDAHVAYLHTLAISGLSDVSLLCFVFLCDCFAPICGVACDTIISLSRKSRSTIGCSVAKSPPPSSTTNQRFDRSRKKQIVEQTTHKTDIHRRSRSERQARGIGCTAWRRPRAPAEAETEAEVRRNRAAHRVAPMRRPLRYASERRSLKQICDLC